MSEPRTTVRRVLRFALWSGIAAFVGATWATRHAAHVPPPRDFHEFVQRLNALSLPPAILLSMLIWVGFSLYWSWAARTASAATQAESRASRMVHLVLISAGQLLVLLPVPWLAQRLWPPQTWIVAAGLGVEVLATALAFWARHVLGRHWSGEITIKQGHELITAGPYAFVRHPIYAGMLGLCVGTTLVWGQLHALIGTAIVALSYVRKVRLEEQSLAGHFGAAWEAYRSRTRALVPGVF